MSVTMPVIKVESGRLNRLTVAYSRDSPLSLSKTLPFILMVFNGFANVLKDNNIAIAINVTNLIIFM